MIRVVDDQVVWKAKREAIFWSNLFMMRGFKIFPSKAYLEFLGTSKSDFFFFFFVWGATRKRILTMGSLKKRG